MIREFTYHITEQDIQKAPSGALLTIQGFLKSLGYSHSVIVSLKRTPQGIVKNGVWARTGDVLHASDTLQIRIEETLSSANIVPIPLPFPVVYEDADLLVINKPSGMPIHPSQGNYDNTLANAAAYYYQQKKEPFIYRCINRLDRDTTGLLILAKHSYSASLLSQMVANRDIHREYLAVVKGKTELSGVVEAPIGRKEGSTIERQVDFEHGDYARTIYRRLYCEGGYSLLSLSLDTGRTHQIRVHMNYIGHPLPGDFLYCPDYTKIRRQALHSYRLSFLHPITKEALSFTAPLPDDMRAFFTLQNIPLR
ncbi:RluA family pseudouridine synthase [Sellimonas caecigallum]|uniref:Pseudouridine synthase n=1 Tax=Sellimonas caecigallum TaxID=2592333 RepID=A0ABS7L3J8_9FIRM|nr:RluA family pseudouridine synthase [Sellimonas caecigallum]MBY0757621.1 RluA family pseudouridine synthase [Sellimonas caecigallum]